METNKPNTFKKIKRNICLFCNKAYWVIKEFIKALSSKDSFFSKKRVESAVAFLIAQWGMVYYINTHITDLSMTDFILWVSVEFFVAGYIINKIEASKVNRFINKNNEQPSDSLDDNKEEHNH